jgi:putative SOS response-associated peptidase YedK
MVARLHDRMPVVIAPEDRERWLKGPVPEGLMKPFPSERMTMWPVSPQLNNVKNDSDDLLEPIEEEDAPPDGEIVRANEGEPSREPTNSE